MKRKIFALEQKGQDATFERHLLGFWQKFPEYRDAVIPGDIESHFNDSEDCTTGRFVADVKEILRLQGVPSNIPPPEIDAGTIMKQCYSPGRPRKDGEVSRTTEWRREKEKEGVPA